MQIYSVRQAENDIAAVFSMGLFSDVNITPHAYRTGTNDNPKVQMLLLAEDEVCSIATQDMYTSEKEDSQSAWTLRTTLAVNSSHSLAGLKLQLRGVLPECLSKSPQLQGRVDLNFNLVEKQTKGISGGGGLTSIGQSEGALPGIVANAAYSQHNLFGLNQKLNASVAIGQVLSGLCRQRCRGMG